MTNYVTGDRALDRKLRLVGGKIAAKAVTAGIRAGLGTLRTSIRAKVSNPRARMTIASRFKRKRRQGQTEAKVGAGVGKHKAGKAARSRPGVGISKQNAHWYFLGTSQRTTKSGANRGAMPSNDAVKRGTQEAQATAMTIVRQKIRTVIHKEVAKLRFK